jgi:hypothetical protein
MANKFGGGNDKSLYTPMSEIEQEVIARLVESGSLRVNIVGWGHVSKPRVTFGDLRVSIAFRLEFDRPEVPMPVSHFDLELRTEDGRLLYKERQSAEYGGRPLQIAAGVYLDMVWDIAIRHMDPKLVKSIMPKAIGLTSRLLDKDTGVATLTGNMALSDENKALLIKLRKGEATIRRGGKK